MYHLYLFIIFVLHSLSFSVLKLISFHLSETETGRWNSAPQDRCHQARKGQHHQDLNKLDNGHLESHAMICGLLHPGPPSLQKSKEGSFALMYTYSIIVSNIIQHQSQSTVCLTLIRSLLSPVFLISNSATLSPATGNSACFKLLTIELGHPNISLEVKTRQGYRIISGYVCSVLYGLYNVSHTLEPRLSHVPTWPDHQPSAQRPGRPKTTVPKIWLKKTDVFDWAIRPGPMTSAEYARTHPRVLHKNRSSNTRPVSSVRCTNFSNGVTRALRDLNFKQFELGTEAVEQAAPGTHCLNRTELWSQFSFTKQNCVHLFLKCFFVKEWLWFPFALRW